MRKLVLALLKIRFPVEMVLDMPLYEASEYLDAWSEMTSPEKPNKRYLVKRPAKDKGSAPLSPQKE